MDERAELADGNGVVAEDPHGGGGCSHWLRAQVLGGAVINFLLLPFKKEKSPASTNGRRMRQRDAGRLVLISAFKRQLRVWFRHKAAG